MSNKIFRYIVPVAACILLLAACEKNSLKTTDIATLTSADAQLKLIFTTAYKSNPSYYYYVNGVRSSNVIAPTSTTAPNVTPFPGGGLNTGGGSTSDYMKVPAAQTTISVAIPKKGTTEDSIQLATTQQTFVANKKHSLYFADTASNLATVLVIDSLNAPDSGYTKFRFVNLMPDVAQGLDLYIGTTLVASSIPYKGVSASFIIPTNNSSTVWAIRPAGAASSTTALTTYSSAASLANQRILTVIARGYNSISTGSDYRRKTICLVFNQ